MDVLFLLLLMAASVTLLALQQFVLLVREIIAYRRACRIRDELYAHLSTFRQEVQNLSQ